MSSISNIVRVVITRGVRSITRAGFGTPLVVGDNGAFVGIRTYTSLSAVAEDFATSDEEYIAATRLFGQERKPTQIKIAVRTANVAQVNTLTPIVQNTALYTVTINGVDFDFTSDGSATAAEIVAGLIAAINAGSEPVTASGVATLILTADQPGIPFTVSQTANLTNVDTTPNNGIVEDLIAFDLADKDWYGLIITSRNVEEILITANWIETQRKVFYFASDQAEILDAMDATDIFSRLQALNLVRTNALYSADEDAYPDAALVGNIFPRDPGSYTEKFKTLVGVVADDLSDTDAETIKAKGGNIYTEVGGVDIVSEGISVGGEFSDIIRFIDWLQAQIEEGIFSKLVAAPKVPYTDSGVAIIEAEIRGALIRGVRVGGLSADPEPTVEVPKVADVATLDRAARILPDVKFFATLAGAIHFTEIEGLVTV